jgi:cation diffusion facilitator CzcD-associated flavoprotein CzcO
MSTDPKHIKTVAVVGGGISGVCSAAHLLRQGLDVTLFERSGIAGGVWHLDQRSAFDPQYPNERPSVGDYDQHPPATGCYSTPPRTPTPTESRSQSTASERSQLFDLTTNELEIRHAPPGPCYEGLKNNVGLRQMKTTLADWPEGLDDFVSQKHLEEYIQSISRSTGVDNIAQYHTRVERISKSARGSPWVVRTTTLTRADEGQDHRTGLTETIWEFDGVVIASGHYNMPRIPDVPGLKEWKKRFPNRVMHSKAYRSPAGFKDKRVLLIGAGVSSTDIAKESEAVAEKIFQSSRGGTLDLPPQMLPANGLRIGGIRAFHLDTESTLEARQHIPGYIELRNGSKLRDIDNVVLATGYVTSYPFLPDLQSDDVKVDDVDERLLVTEEGNMVHNLDRDIFYIPDPTLAFVGVPYHISTFSLFEFQAQVVARVFAGLAELPAPSMMRERYRQRVAARGLGRDFHSLRPDGAELAYVRELVAWMNEDADCFNATPMQGHTEVFLEAYEEQRERLKALGRRLERGVQGENFDHVQV